jgi:hypothetical protein
MHIDTNNDLFLTKVEISDFIQQLNQIQQQQPSSELESVAIGKYLKSFNNNDSGIKYSGNFITKGIL